MDNDIAACEKKLGKEPELGTNLNENQNVTLSKNVTDRLESAGTVDSDRLDNYDNYWLNKLACIDESHSVRNNLDIDEAEKKLQSLIKYTQSFDVKKDSISEQISEKDRVKECFELSPGQTLRCSIMVENFVEEVDRLMYDAVRKDPSASYQLSDKKLTYAERFKRDFRF